MPRGRRKIAWRLGYWARRLTGWRWALRLMVGNLPPDWTGSGAKLGDKAPW